MLYLILNLDRKIHYNVRGKWLYEALVSGKAMIWAKLNKTAYNFNS